MPASKVAFHGICALMTMGVCSAVPFSPCVAIPVLGLMAAFSLGRRSAEGDGEEERPLPWYVLLHATAMFIGCGISTAWLIFSVKRG